MEFPTEISSIVTEGLEGLGVHDGLERAGELGEELAEKLADGVEGAVELIDMSIEHLQGFAELLPAELRSIADGLIGALEVLKSGMEFGADWVRENKELVAAGCEILVVAGIAFANPAELVEHIANSPETQAMFAKLIQTVMG
jgi:hypothetical protein